MASKKKPNRSRPQSGSRSGPKPAGAKPAGAKAAPAKPAAPKGPTRAERLAAAEKARRAKALRTRALVAAAIVGVLALITVTVISSRRSNARTVSKLEAGSCNYDTKADSDRGAGSNHVSGDLRYSTDPPAGGNHNPSAAPAGISAPETRPPDGQLVHALEHGYVTIWYRPDLDTASLDGLRALVGRYPRDVLLVPRGSLPQPVAVTAWHRRLLCPQTDLKATELFVTAYRNKGPEKIPH